MTGTIVSLVKRLIWCIPPPIAQVHVAVDSMAVGVSKGHCFNIEVCLKCEMFHKELDTLENFPVV
jgi:hypothetical protein